MQISKEVFGETFLEGNIEGGTFGKNMLTSADRVMRSWLKELNILGLDRMMTLWAGGIVFRNRDSRPLIFPSLDENPIFLTQYSHKDPAHIQDMAPQQFLDANVPPEGVLSRRMPRILTNSSPALSILFLSLALPSIPGWGSGVTSSIVVVCFLPLPPLNEGEETDSEICEQTATSGRGRGRGRGRKDAPHFQTQRIRPRLEPHAVGAGASDWSPRGHVVYLPFHILCHCEWPPHPQAGEVVPYWN